jgi:hypothetical protein
MVLSRNRVIVWLLGALILLAGGAAGPAQGSGGALPAQVAAMGAGAAAGAAPVVQQAVPAPPLQGTPTPPPCYSLWNLVPSPNAGNDNNELRGVVALSATNAWAVGSFVTRYSVTNTVRSTLITHWTGSAWTQVPSPSPGSAANNLYAVAAVNANDIWAVGNSDDGFSRPSLIVHWDGSAWTQVPSPNAANSNILYGVTALAANDVWAVGTSSSPYQAFILHWNGSAWTQVPGVNPGSINILYGVTAVAANDIWAVGDYVTGSGLLQSLIEHWNGSAWTWVPSPNPGTASNLLAGVDAVASNDVWAVGAYADSSVGPFKTMAAHWNGTAWSNVAIPNIGSRSNYLQGITAVAANDVWTVGYYGDTYQTQIQHWNGSFWSVVNTTEPGPRKNILYAVSAASASDIWAVGYTTNASNLTQTLTERYTGVCSTNTPTSTPAGTPPTPVPTATAPPTLSPTITSTPPPTLPPSATPTHTATPVCALGWNVVGSPNVGSATNELTGVTVLSGGDVWAVGTYLTAGNTAQTLIEHWNGTAWSVIASPNVGLYDNHLTAVVGRAANDVWAVGYYLTSANQRLTLILHWDGSAWSIATTPNVAGANNYLNGVAGAGGDVWAVGYTVTGINPAQTLILRYTGGTWSIAPSPNPGSAGNVLNGVAATAANDAWVAGSTDNGSGSQTLTVHWDGSTWSVVASPSVTTDPNTLIGITALATNDAWAVCTVNQAQTLILHWNGTAWSSVSSPNPGNASNILYGVAGVVANDVWAAGTSSSPYQALLVHWNGSAWNPVAAAAGVFTPTLLAVAAGPGGEAWAVGSALNGATRQTLVERYANPCITPSPTPTVTGTPPTATRTGTPTPPGPPPATDTPSATVTGTPPTATPTATVCPLSFNDVPVGSTFYPWIRCLACRGIVGGYPCGGPGEPCPGAYYRPNNNVTRGQTSKIVAEAAGFSDPVPSTQQTFQDVAPGSTFHVYVERIAGRGIISGYPCGGPFEPCVAPDNRPYFRPNNNVTRGQIAKITSGAAQYSETPTGQTFEDVAPGSTFYLYIERIASRGIISGYPCGGPFEPCIAPGNRPYFRPNNNATRGQMSKIAASAFYPNCQTPARR